MAEDGKGIPLVRRGDPVKAKTENDIIRALQTLAWKVSRAEHKSKSDPDRILVRNDTGEDITVDHGVVGIGDSLTDPFTEDEVAETYRMPYVAGETPNSDDHENKFAILTSAVKEGETVEAIVSGSTWVRVLVEDEDHAFADMETDETDYLKSAGGGLCRILFLGEDERESEDEDDIRWAVVVFGSTGGTCDEVDEFYVQGEPSSGTADVQYTLDGDPTEEPGPVADTIVIDWNATAADVKTALESHSVIADLITDGEAIDDLVSVFGGPLPNVAVYVLWKGAFGGRAIAFPSIDSGDFDEGKLRMRKVSSADWRGY